MNRYKIAFVDADSAKYVDADSYSVGYLNGTGWQWNGGVPFTTVDAKSDGLVHFWTDGKPALSVPVDAILYIERVG